MLIGYSRQSTSKQDHTAHIDALKRAGCERIFVETASGMKENRPELARALEYARDGEDVLVVHSLSRLARSLRQLISTVDDLQRRGIGLRSLSENLDTSTPSGVWRCTFSLLFSSSRSSSYASALVLASARLLHEAEGEVALVRWMTKS